MTQQKEQPSAAEREVKLKLEHDENDSYAIYRIYDGDELVCNLQATRWQDNNAKTKAKFYGEIIVEAVNNYSRPNEAKAVGDVDVLIDAMQLACKHILSRMPNIALYSVRNPLTDLVCAVRFVKGDEFAKQFFNEILAETQNKVDKPQVEGFDCPECNHRHAGGDLAYICIGCPCPATNLSKA